MANNTPNPFRSANLLYVAPESPDHDDLFLRIQRDPPTFANSNARLLKPQSRKDAADYQKTVTEEALLGVVICLPSGTQNAETAGAGVAGGDGVTPIGTIFLKPAPPTIAQHRFSEIGIDIVPEYQGRGYGTEAIRWILDWAYDVAGLHRVMVRAFEWNTGARRLYERIGFRLEGVTKEELWYQGKWWDGYQYGMLDREWREIRGKTEG